MSILPQPLTGAELDSLDPEVLMKELDRVKIQVFLNSNSAFLATIMSSLDFHWSRDIPTAATNGISFWWNPEWFLELPLETRKTVLVHELWHVAFLHMIRAGSRDHKIWNYACDIRINNGLEQDGFSFKAVEDCWKDQQYGLQAEEDIYDVLMSQATKIPNPSWGPGPCTPNGSGGQSGQGAQGPNGNTPSSGTDQVDQDGDMFPMDSHEKQQVIGNVVRAIQQAKLSGQAGSIPGGLEQMVDSFLAPVIPWEVEFQKFFNDLLEEDFSWRRPNRRFQDIYLPSRYQDEGRLEHLMYYQDVSGSITDGEILRFNSELKYVWDTFQPKKMTIVQFDTRITQEDIFEDGDSFEKIKIVGRGGTNLRPVRDHIQEHKPTAAVIFSDLYVPPMQKLDVEIPIIWATTTKDAKVPFGKLIRIPPEKR